MDPNSQTNPQFSVPTTQPMTHSGLPPESPLATPAKRGSRKWVIILVIIAFLIVGVGGIYAFTTINGNNGKNTSNENSAVVPKLTLPPLESATSSAVATSSATIDPTDPNLMVYDSPCMSFKYPNDWIIVRSDVSNKHNVQTGYDSFGTTLVVLGKNYNNPTPKADTFLVRFQCQPNVAGLTLEQYVNSLLTGTNLNTGAKTKIQPDNTSKITVSDVPGMRITVNSEKGKDPIDLQGVVNVAGIKETTIFDSALEWDDPVRNDPDLAGQKEFSSIISSVQIKDYFKKQ